jgi:hypothetical protein
MPDPVILGGQSNARSTTQIVLEGDRLSGLWVTAKGEGAWGLRTDGNDRGLVATSTDNTGGTAVEAISDGSRGTAISAIAKGDDTVGLKAIATSAVHALGKEFGLWASGQTAIEGSGQRRGVVGISLRQDGVGVEAKGRTAVLASGSERGLLAEANGIAIECKTAGEGPALQASASLDGGIGVKATGHWGVHADGDDIAVVARGSTGLRAIGGHIGIEADASMPDTGVGIRGTGGDAGVWGSGEKVGVRAEGAALALEVRGKLRLSRSGITRMKEGLSKVTVEMPDLTEKTLVVATIQGAPIGSVCVQSAQVIPSDAVFTLCLNQAVPAGTEITVGWMLLE